MIASPLAIVTVLDPSRVDAVLANIKKAFHAYVFPDVAAKAVRMLEENAPKYEAISDPVAFLQMVNDDLLSVTHDKHVRLFCPFEDHDNDDPAVVAAHSVNELARNFGFVSVRRLPGNVGYIDFRYFSGDSAVGQTIASAMTFLANTSVLIIDLRNNGGGSPIAAQTLEAYFFSKQQQITSIIWRDSKTGETREEQQFTAATVPGPLYIAKPVYILISSKTFSCAEQFTYDLHNLKRATLVGETTSGGAHPGSRAYAVGADFGISIPDGRAYSPVTKTNWEGTGIAPNVQVPAAQAPVTAYKTALNYIKEHGENSSALDEASRALIDPAKALSGEGWEG